jgi:surface polysaccharide O-acyltransferase-like enzyme
MTEQTSAKPRTRLFFLDNLRIYLTILVILVHAAIPYGGPGNWYLRDPAVDEISPIFLTLFTAITQSYFMSAFFLLAGYFTPRSFERKGTAKFLIDRFIRLGIPIVLYTTLLRHINGYLVVKVGERREIPFSAILRSAVTQYDPGHLWFLQLLLVFAIVYVVYRALADRRAQDKPIQLYPDRFPPDAILFACIAVLTVLTFFERLIWSVGEAIFMNFQAGFFVHYVFCLFVGVLAYRGDWFRRLSKGQARRWGIMSLVAMPLLLVLMVLGGVLESEDNLAKFTGGAYWQSFAFSLWSTFIMVGVIVYLLYFFRERLSRAGSLAQSMAANVYTVYIIHQTILVALHIIMLRVQIPTILKFLTVSAIAVPVCFLLSDLIRRIPYAKRVLG